MVLIGSVVCEKFILKWKAKTHRKQNQDKLMQLTRTDTKRSQHLVQVDVLLHFWHIIQIQTQTSFSSYSINTVWLRGDTVYNKLIAFDLTWQKIKLSFSIYLVWHLKSAQESLNQRGSWTNKIKSQCCRVRGWLEPVSLFFG